MNGQIHCSYENQYEHGIGNLNGNHDTVPETNEEGDNVTVECPAGCTVWGGPAIKPLPGPDNCNVVPKKREN